MKNSSDKQKMPALAGERNVERDMERIREQCGKGLRMEEIADLLNLDRGYVEVLFWFGML